MAKEFTPKEKYTGNFNGQEVSFTREWNGYKFTDEECEALLAGNAIIVESVSKKNGNKFSVCGELGLTEYNGKQFYAFIPDFNRKIIPITYCGHMFSEQERKDLENGRPIIVRDLVSKKGSTFAARLNYSEEKGIEMDFEGVSK